MTFLSSLFSAALVALMVLKEHWFSGLESVVRSPRKHKLVRYMTKKKNRKIESELFWYLMHNGRQTKVTMNVKLEDIHCTDESAELVLKLYTTCEPLSTQ